MEFFSKTLQVRFGLREIARIEIAVGKNPEVKDMSQYIRGAVLQRLNHDVPQGSMIVKGGDDE